MLKSLKLHAASVSEVGFGLPSCFPHTLGAEADAAAEAETCPKSVAAMSDASMRSEHFWRKSPAERVTTKSHDAKAWMWMRMQPPLLTIPRRLPGAWAQATQAGLLISSGLTVELLSLRGSRR